MRVQELPFGKTIGGHAISTILGFNPRQTKYELWEILTGKKENKFTPTFESEAGHALEPIILKYWAFENNADLEPGVNIVHDKKPFLTGHLDAIAKLSDGSSRVIEAKTASFSKALEFGLNGTDQVPQHYALQVYWYMMLANIDIGHVAARFKDSLHDYILYRDKELEGAMYEAAVNFWEKYVLADNPPAPSSNKEIIKFYPRSSKTSIEASPVVLEAWERLASLKQEIKSLDAKKEELELSIKSFMGENESLKFGARTLATWKSNLTKRLDGNSLKDKMPEVYESFIKPLEVRTFLVK